MTEYSILLIEDDPGVADSLQGAAAKPPGQEAFGEVMGNSTLFQLDSQPLSVYPCSVVRKEPDARQSTQNLSPVG